MRFIWFYAWLPVVAWMGVIFLFSSLPSFPTPFIIWWDMLLKKAAHVIEYAVLMALLYRAFWYPNRYYKVKNYRSNLADHYRYLRVAALIALLYAMSDEWHQSFTPGRGPTIRDVFIDSGGILLSSWMIQRFKPIKAWLIEGLPIAEYQRYL